jgi:protein O-GlcNAc transferase
MQPTFLDLTRTLSLNPRDVTALCTLGRMYAAAGRTTDATACFTQALQVEPQHPQSLLDFGMMLALAKRATEGQALLQRAKSAGAAPGPVHLGLGLCKLESGDLEGAEADFRKAMRLEPQLPDAGNNLGVTLDRLGRLEDAVNAFRRVTRTHPNYPPPYANLGDALSRAGRPEEAIAAFRQWVNLEPRNADAHARLGGAQLAVGEVHAASQSLRHAVSIDPTLHEACANLGEALRSLHDFDGAADAFRQALRVRPDFAEAHLGLGRVELARGRAEADSHFMMAARLRPSDSRLMLAVAKALDSIGKSDAALAVLERFPVSPDTLELCEMRVDLLIRAGGLETSIEILERLIGLQPARTDLRFRRADALEALGRCEEAIEQILAQPGNEARTAREFASLLG